MNIFDLHAKPKKLVHYKDRLNIPELAVNEYLWAEDLSKKQRKELKLRIGASPRLSYAMLDHLSSRDKDQEYFLSVIATDPVYAAKYSDEFILRRWPEAEKYIMQDGPSAYLYVTRNFKDGWPEAEPAIMKDAASAARYAAGYLKRRWPEAEPYILESPRWAYAYAYGVLKERWPEAEAAIAKNPFFAKSYDEKFGTNLRGL